MACSYMDRVRVLMHMYHIRKQDAHVLKGQPKIFPSLNFLNKRTWTSWSKRGQRQKVQLSMGNHWLRCSQLSANVLTSAEPHKCYSSLNRTWPTTMTGPHASPSSMLSTTMDLVKRTTCARISADLKLVLLSIAASVNALRPP